MNILKGILIADNAQIFFDRGRKFVYTNHELQNAVTASLPFQFDFQKLPEVSLRYRWLLDVAQDKPLRCVDLS